MRMLKPLLAAAAALALSAVAVAAGESHAKTRELLKAAPYRQNAHQARASSNALASIRTGVSKPSVNQL